MTLAPDALLFGVDVTRKLTTRITTKATPHSGPQRSGLSCSILPPPCSRRRQANHLQCPTSRTFGQRELAVRTADSRTPDGMNPPGYTPSLDLTSQA